MSSFKTATWPPGRAKHQYGFTLVELLVVLVILGLIFGLVAPQVLQYVGRSKSKAAAIQIERLSTVLELFYLDVGRYPSTTEGLDALYSKPRNLQVWNGPYIKKSNSLMDPWNRPYNYRSPGEHADFDIQSLGADGREGGSGENADINSWE